MNQPNASRKPVHPPVRHRKVLHLAAVQIVLMDEIDAHTLMTHVHKHTVRIPKSIILRKSLFIVQHRSFLCLGFQNYIEELSVTEARRTLFSADKGERRGAPCSSSNADFQLG